MSIKGHIHVKDMPWGNIVTHKDTYRRGRNLGLAAGLFIGGCAGFILGMSVTGYTEPQHECNRDAIIFNHYAKVADKIHGEAYRPELLPPRPKPITPMKPRG